MHTHLRTHTPTHNTRTCARALFSFVFPSLSSFFVSLLLSLFLFFPFFSLSILSSSLLPSSHQVFPLFCQLVQNFADWLWRGKGVSHPTPLSDGPASDWKTCNKLTRLYPGPLRSSRVQFRFHGPNSEPLGFRVRYPPPKKNTSSLETIWHPFSTKSLTC